MTLFAEISTYDARRSPLAWAYAIATWECRTVRRTRSRSRELATESVDLESAADAELEAEERDVLQRALALVASLSDFDRDTLEDELLDRAEPTTAGRQRRRRMLTRLRTAWRRLYGP